MSDAIVKLEKMRDRLVKDIGILESRAAEGRECLAALNEVLGFKRDQMEAEKANGNSRPIPQPDNGNKFFTALSDGGIEIGLGLPQPFSASDLESRLDGGNAAQRAYSFIAAWKRKEWLVDAGYRQYRRAENFGVRE